jgi:hypothetical protein
MFGGSRTKLATRGELILAIVVLGLYLFGCPSSNLPPVPEATPVVGSDAWFFPIQPPPGDGEVFYVGPYETQAQCQDTFGSAIFSHPIKCHETGLPADCVNTGNGFAYPASWPYPVPAPLTLTRSQLCVKQPVTALNNRSGLFFLFYGPNGASGVKACSAYAADRALADKAGSKYLIGNYANMQCPGAPCFTIPVDSACD